MNVLPRITIKHYRFVMYSKWINSVVRKCCLAVVSHFQWDKHISLLQNLYIKNPGCFIVLAPGLFYQSYESIKTAHFKAGKITFVQFLVFN
jgi:hypothetical protein